MRETQQKIKENETTLEISKIIAFELYRRNFDNKFITREI